ncbi:MAG: class I SAM-dependent methyltransferase [Acidimicrobiia bacterium]
MGFAVSADAYDSFMGRYSVPLASRFADFARIGGQKRVLDVGCGPGALTAELAKRLGTAAIAAVDPSEHFVTAARVRLPEVDIRRASAEHLPFEDATYDAALAQLVVHFMTDPVGGLAEMGRVTRTGGVVAACVWDHAGEKGPLHTFWKAARQLEANINDESELAGAREGHLGELFRGAGLAAVEEGALSVAVEHPTFEDWWDPFTLGVGPAGAHVAALNGEKRTELRERCRQMLGPAPFTIPATAWAARGVTEPE